MLFWTFLTATPLDYFKGFLRAFLEYPKKESLEGGFESWMLYSLRMNEFDYDYECINLFETVFRHRIIQGVIVRDPLLDGART